MSLRPAYSLPASAEASGPLPKVEPRRPWWVVLLYPFGRVCGRVAW